MDLMYSFENQGQSALNGLDELKSSFSGINNASDVRSKYGIKSTAASFAPMYKMLSANKAKGMQGAQFRSGRSASPEMSFSGEEGNYQNGLNSLFAQQEQADTGQQSMVAQLLQSALSGNNQFGLQKAGLQGQMSSQLMGNRLNMEQFNRQGEGPKPWDIISSILGAAAPIAGAAAGKPSTNFNFGNPGQGGKDPGWQGTGLG